MAGAGAQLFIQNTIALVWDFDKTLTHSYMQDPLFEHYGVDSLEFWRETNQLSGHYESLGLERVSSDLLYLNRILTYVKCGKFPGLTNELLRTLGGQIKLAPGLPEFFAQIKKHIASTIYVKHEIHVEHYIVSTGLRQMILGSGIAEHVDDVWACEFVEDEPEPGWEGKEGQTELKPPLICQVGYAIDNTSKTRALFEINKGTNKLAEIDVNASIEHTERRVPFPNMIYIADGPSDIPCFSILNQYNGKTFAVYKPGSSDDFRQARALVEQRRVQGIGPADYREDSQTALWLTNEAEAIAARILRDRERALGDRVGKPPSHLV
jgi:hypothetical protein